LVVRAENQGVARAFHLVH